jgi:hypothetical protein
MLVFQTVGWGNKRDKVTGHRAVHRHRIPQMRMGIEKSRADPDIRGFVISLNSSDETIVDHDINLLE